MPRMIHFVDDTRDMNTVITSDPYVIIATSRSGIKEAAHIESMQYPAIYILLSDDGEMVYVGQARSGALKRIKQHIHDEEKGWFENCIVITKLGKTDTEQLNYIEKEFIRLSGIVGLDVKNKNRGNTPVISYHNKVQAEAMLEKCMDLIDEFCMSFTFPVPVQMFDSELLDEEYSYQVQQDHNEDSFEDYKAVMDKYFNSENIDHFDEMETEEFPAVEDPIVTNKDGNVSLPKSVLDRANSLLNGKHY